MEATRNRSILIIPTFNEASSLEILLKEVFSLPLDDLDVIVIDDNSPDGTDEVVLRHKEYRSRLFLISRSRKSGYGSAVKEGILWGLKRGYDGFVQMDADRSHDPQDIGALLSCLKDNADFVVGSRYLGGIRVINWPLFRLLLSIGAGIYTRLLTGMPLSDPTIGFRAFKRKVLEELEWARIESDGYGFIIETNFYAYLAGFCFQEIPIVFTDRVGGKSKLSLAIAFESALKVPQLFFLRLFRRRKKRRCSEREPL